MSDEIVVLRKNELVDLMKDVAKEVIAQYEIKRNYQENGSRVYNVSEVQKILRCGYGRVRTMIKDGGLKITTSGKITGESLNKYLEGVKL